MGCMDSIEHGAGECPDSREEKKKRDADGRAFPWKKVKLKCEQLQHSAKLFVNEPCARLQHPKEIESFINNPQPFQTSKSSM